MAEQHRAFDSVLARFTNQYGAERAQRIVDICKKTGADCDSSGLNGKKELAIDNMFRELNKAIEESGKHQIDGLAYVLSRATLTNVRPTREHLNGWLVCGILYKDENGIIHINDKDQALPPLEDSELELVGISPKIQKDAFTVFRNRPDFVTAYRCGKIGEKSGKILIERLKIKTRDDLTKLFDAYIAQEENKA